MSRAVTSGAMLAQVRVALPAVSLVEAQVRPQVQRLVQSGASSVAGSLCSSEPPSELH